MPSILLVDDDVRQMDLRKALLESAGHQVRTALGAADAYRQLRGAVPELLLMDLRFPNAQGDPDAGEGLALIRGVRELAPGLPVIVLSGWPEDIEGRPEEKMVAKVVTKPCRLSVLLEAIGRVLALLVCGLALAAGARAQTFRFRVDRRAEVVAEVEMSSPGSDWSQAGREAALATLTVDARQAQHAMLYAGAEAHTYAAFLGELEAGEHTLAVERHAGYSAAGTGLRVGGVKFRQVAEGEGEWTMLAHAPVLYARADTIGQFTDVPMIAYCERLEEEGKPYLQYTVIFSNEDGGTSTRALMARWGRTTDIEYIYKAWLDARGKVAQATIQAKDHHEIAFDGRYEGTHPVLIPSTRNNMVSGQGRSEIRCQIAPVAIDLSAHSREEVMDRHPWSYRVMAQELAREGKLRAFGEVAGEAVSDPRNYLYLEAKVANRTSAVGVVVKLKGESTWRSSHLGRADYGITRDGWVRSTVELPPGTRPQDLDEIGFECLVEPARPEHLDGTCRVEAVSKAFFLDREYRPGVSVFALHETVELPSGQMRGFPVTPIWLAISGAPVFARGRNPLSAWR
jgi:CheY-like chemotaxis protein